MGVVLIILGFIDHAGKELSGLPERTALSKLTVILLLLGGYGFLSMFYWAGAHSVPRRYAIHRAEIAASHFGFDPMCRRVLAALAIAPSSRECDGRGWH
jgi:heme/copper-type cytochrome/quinol oxidase subunit 1